MIRMTQTTASRRTGLPRALRSKRLLAIPAIVLLLVFLFGPIAQNFWQSFSDPELGFGNYERIITDGFTLKVIGRTILTSLCVGLLALVIAYPYAYLMAVAGKRTTAVLVMIVLLPFWTSLMARNFAWVLLLQKNGPVHSFFALFGLDVVLLGTLGGVVIAMTQVLLPFVVLPLYSSMTGIDHRLVQAAGTLGAKPWSAFWRVYFPLSLPGVIGGFSLVFVTALGFYVTPAIVGSPQHALVAQLISQRVRPLLDFPGAGVIGVLVLLAAGLVLLLTRSLNGLLTPRKRSRS